ncbi:MAG: hypothetical protein HYV60_22270 [Planctomycetia bacterium]|nr:hypothetical protein [Planctomycetia bacterium]
MPSQSWQHISTEYGVCFVISTLRLLESHVTDRTGRPVEISHGGKPIRDIMA